MVSGVVLDGVVESGVEEPGVVVESGVVDGVVVESGVVEGVVESGVVPGAVVEGTVAGSAGEPCAGAEDPGVVGTTTSPDAGAFCVDGVVTDPDPGVDAGADWLGTCAGAA